MTDDRYLWHDNPPRSRPATQAGWWLLVAFITLPLWVVGGAFLVEVLR